MSTPTHLCLDTFPVHHAHVLCTHICMCTRQCTQHLDSELYLRPALVWSVLQSNANGWGYAVSMAEPPLLLWSVCGCSAAPLSCPVSHHTNFYFSLCRQLTCLLRKHAVEQTCCVQPCAQASLEAPCAGYGDDGDVVFFEDARWFDSRVQARRQEAVPELNARLQQVRPWENLRDRRQGMLCKGGVLVCFTMASTYRVASWNKTLISDRRKQEQRADKPYRPHSVHPVEDDPDEQQRGHDFLVSSIFPRS